jgi:hypothetical protein
VTPTALPCRKPKRSKVRRGLKACRAAANSEPDRPGVRLLANAGGASELYREVLNRRAAQVAKLSKGS